MFLFLIKEIALNAGIAKDKSSILRLLLTIYKINKKTVRMQLHFEKYKQ